jgi:hypothetical protein
MKSHPNLPNWCCSAEIALIELCALVDRLKNELEAFLVQHLVAHIRLDVFFPLLVGDHEKTRVDLPAPGTDHWIIEVGDPALLTEHLCPFLVPFSGRQTSNSSSIGGGILNPRAVSLFSQQPQKSSWQLQ